MITAIEETYVNMVMYIMQRITTKSARLCLLKDKLLRFIIIVLLLAFSLEHATEIYLLYYMID